MAGGLWKPREIWKAISDAKSACSPAEALTLQWVHVDSHTGGELNDRADGLAAHGGSVWTKALHDLLSETGGHHATCQETQAVLSCRVSTSG